MHFSREDYFKRKGLMEQMSIEEWDNIKEFPQITQGVYSQFGTYPVRIYFDMDGTLAVFNKDATMEEIFSPGYFRNLAPLKNITAFAKELWKNGYDIHILSGACYMAVQEKIEWLQEYMPFLPVDQYTFVPVGADKSSFIPDPKHSVLIDDYNKNLDEWKGLAIKCKTNINSFNPRYPYIKEEDNFKDNIKRLEMAIGQWIERQRGDYTLLDNTLVEEER